MTGNSAKPQYPRRAQLHFLLLSGLFAALTAAGSYLRIPLYPVPITMQTFFVVLAGAMLGNPYGPLSQAIYLLIGLIGFPVFAHGGGPAYVLQPTFGYLLGYPLAAFLAAWLIHGGRRFGNLLEIRARLGACSSRRMALAAGLAMLGLFGPGVAYLYAISRWVLHAPIALKQATYAGFLIFIPGDLIKIIGIVMVLRMLGSRTSRAR